MRVGKQQRRRALLHRSIIVLLKRFRTGILLARRKLARTRNILPGRRLRNLEQKASMSRFVLDLVLYYAFATSAEAAAVSTSDAMQCSRTYEQAKTHFYDPNPAPRGTAARVEQSNAVFATFRAWEAENPGEVAVLKAMARDWAGSGPPA
jgi:hypothetical protein